MPLLAPNGNIVVIKNLELLSGTITIERWENQAHYTNGATPYYKPLTEYYQISMPFVFNHTVDVGKNLLANMFDICYAALLLLNAFMGYTLV